MILCCRIINYHKNMKYFTVLVVLLCLMALVYGKCDKNDDKIIGKDVEKNNGKSKAWQCLLLAPK